MRSKQSNGYDDAFMEACREEMTVSETDITDTEFWVAESDELCGCVSLKPDADRKAGEVHAFFIEPSWKRQGIGKLLWGKLIERARANGLKNLRLDADPEAVPFYEAMGFQVISEVPSGSIEGRMIPHMTIRLDDDQPG